jgi:cephalosporin-C deacetylase-like acetyl esterase
VDKERVAVGGVSLGGLVSVMAVAREPRFWHTLFSNPKGFPIFVPDAVSFLDAQLNR